MLPKRKKKKNFANRLRNIPKRWPTSKNETLCILKSLKNLSISRSNIQMTRAKYSIMLRAFLMKNLGGLVWYLLIYSKEKETNCVMKAAALLLFPRKACQAILCSMTVLEAEWHVAWFAGASNISTVKAAVHTDAVVIILSHVLELPVHQMANVTNPSPPHMHSLPHM